MVLIYENDNNACATLWISSHHVHHGGGDESTPPKVVFWGYMVARRVDPHAVNCKIRVLKQGESNGTTPVFRGCVCDGGLQGGGLGVVESKTPKSSTGAEIGGSRHGPPMQL